MASKTPTLPTARIPQGIPVARTRYSHTPGCYGDRFQPRNSLYSSTRWRKFRIAYLQEHPLCLPCQQAGRLTPATQIDHVAIEVRDSVEHQFDESNLQPICANCHSRKTIQSIMARRRMHASARRDGGNPFIC